MQVNSTNPAFGRRSAEKPHKKSRPLTTGLAIGAGVGVTTGIINSIKGYKSLPQLIEKSGLSLSLEDVQKGFKAGAPIGIITATVLTSLIGLGIGAIVKAVKKGKANKAAQKAE